MIARVHELYSGLNILFIDRFAKFFQFLCSYVTGEQFPITSQWVFWLGDQAEAQFGIFIYFFPHKKSEIIGSLGFEPKEDMISACLRTNID